MQSLFRDKLGKLKSLHLRNASSSKSFHINLHVNKERDEALMAFVRTTNEKKCPHVNFAFCPTLMA